MSNEDLRALIALDAACLLAAAMMVRSWYRRRTRPPLVAGAFIIGVALAASALVAIGIGSRLVVGPTFIIALLVIMYTARYERRTATAVATPAAPPASAQTQPPARRPRDGGRSSG